MVRSNFFLLLVYNQKLFSLFNIEILQFLQSFLKIRTLIELFISHALLRIAISVLNHSIWNEIMFLYCLILLSHMENITVGLFPDCYFSDSAAFVVQDHTICSSLWFAG